MEKKYQSTTIQKALDILNLFKKNGKLSFTEIKDKLGYNKSTLFRVLYTLEHNKYLSKDKHGRYELGINIFILGNQLSGPNKLKKVAAPYLKTLSMETNLTVHLGILEGLNIIIIDKYNPPKSSINMVSRIGSSVPVHCTGQGKTLLAYSSKVMVEKIVNHHGLKRYTPHTITTFDDLLNELDIIRKRGYTIDDSEHEQNIRCIGVPIFNQEGEVEAALSITGLVMNLQDEEEIEKHVNILQETKDKIEEKLCYKEQ